MLSVDSTRTVFGFLNIELWIIVGILHQRKTVSPWNMPQSKMVWPLSEASSVAVGQTGICIAVWLARMNQRGLIAVMGLLRFVERIKKIHFRQ